MCIVFRAVRLLNHLFLFWFPQKSSRTPSPVEISEEDKNTLNASLSFGYGLIQVAFSIVPTALLKVCEMFGFQANREVGLDALKISSHSGDMKAPIARLTLLWYHTVVRPFCALDGNNIERGEYILRVM